MRSSRNSSPARRIAFFLLAALLPVFAQAQKGVAAKPAFVIAGDHFALNGKPIQVLSGEMHYARIPRAYWRARMKMAKAMGLNTIATYVFWNVHEPRPGVYDFNGNNDLAVFIRLAQVEHLHVLLRAGPYSCAEWEMGGYPSWLLADPKMSAVLRTNDPAFMVPVERWITRLAKEVAPLQLGRGGPIIAVQIENEYGIYGNDAAYMQHMRDIFIHAGFNGTDAMLYTVDPGKALAAGGLDGIMSGVNFGTGGAVDGIAALATARPKQPLFVTEYWPGWFDHWGHPHETRPSDKQVEDLQYILGHKSSVNIYMFHGGTSFGFMNGASGSNKDKEYLPDVTSYDYDAPLDEAGHPTPKFYAYRKVLARYAGHPLPPVPASPPVISVAPFAIDTATSLWDNLPAPVINRTPLTMEALGQSYGYVLYRKQLDAAAKGPLVFDEIHDYARIYIDGKLAGTVDRRLRQDRIEIDAAKGARLDILVENSGRINVGHEMTGEVKGITHSVTLAGAPLEGWTIYSLPMNNPGKMHPPAAAGVSIIGPRFAFAHFDLKRTGDTFLDVSALGKGALWVNGHALGRFWNEGPQKTLYVPGPWLRAGRNDIVLFDIFDPSSAKPMLEGRTTPVLNAPILSQPVLLQKAQP